MLLAAALGLLRRQAARRGRGRPHPVRGLGRLARPAVRLGGGGRGHRRARRMPEVSPACSWSAFVVAFLLGYFLYGALYAAVGAAVNSQQEAQTLVFPVMAPHAHGLPVLSRGAGQPGQRVLHRRCRWCRFFAPLLMFLRVAAAPPPAWQLALCVACAWPRSRPSPGSRPGSTAWASSCTGSGRRCRRSRAGCGRNSVLTAGHARGLLVAASSGECSARVRPPRQAAADAAAASSAVEHRMAAEPSAAMIGGRANAEEPPGRRLLVGLGSCRTSCAARRRTCDRARAVDSGSATLLAGPGPLARSWSRAERPAACADLRSHERLHATATRASRLRISCVLQPRVSRTRAVCLRLREPSGSCALVGCQLRQTGM